MASEIRVDKINSLSGVGTVTLSPTGVDIAGITTAATLKVGTGVTASSDGDVFATGVCTATTFVGALTGNVTGTLQTAAQANVTSLGTLTGLTVNGDASFTGASYNMTWDKSDNSLVVNDDARIKFGTGKDLHIYHNQSNSVIREEGTGNLNLQTTGGNVEILVNTSETAAKFISNGAVELYHNNSKKFDTDSEGISITGTVKINNTSAVGDYNGGADDMLIGTHSGNHGLTILSGTSNGGYIMFSDNNGGGTNAYRGQIEYAHSSDYMRFITDSGERVRILSGGGITFNGDTATANALDDYEEGSFTPAFGGGISASSYHNQYGFYTKTGDQVYAYIYLRANSASTGSANVTVTGLPYTCNGAAGYEGGGYFTYLNGFFGTAVDNEHFHPMPWVSLGNTYAVFHTPADGNNITGSDTVPGNKYCIFHLRYRAA